MQIAIVGHNAPAKCLRRSTTGYKMKTKSNPFTHEDPWPPLRVLCVDDNRDCADSAAILLNLMGFEAKACYDGPSALEINDTFRPAICFLDLNMPGMDGDELAGRLRSREWRPLLLIAVTAMSNEISCARIVAADFDMHLVKPVGGDKLLEVVNLLFRVAERTTRWNTGES
jgi:two-component system, OmpR family, response regulator